MSEKVTVELSSRDRALIRRLIRAVRGEPDPVDEPEAQRLTEE